MNLYGKNLVEIKKIFEPENGIFLVPLLAYFVGNTYIACPYKELL